MARSILRAFVSGTRQMLAAQLFISIGAVALAGWTLGVTNDLIRERDRLRERVIQLEETLAASDIVVPPTAEVVNPQRADTAYPPSVPLPENTPPPAEESPTPATPETEPAAPIDEKAPEAEPERPFNPGQILGELFAPAPPMRTVVLHARSDTDARVARRLADELSQSANVRVTVDVMPPRDPRESGYSYFDGRQSRTAAGLMQRFHDIARRNEVAAWSAQLRGVALPAQGEYTADRLDIVLPALPVSSSINPNLQLQRIDPRALQQQQQRAPTIR